MAYLLVYEGEVLKEQRELTGETLTIGRATDNDVVLANPGVSGHHATIARNGETFELTDNGSSNGVYVDGKRVERHPLKYWEDIQVLDFVLKFRPRGRLPGEKGGDLEIPDEVQEGAATAEIDVSGIRDTLERHSRNNRRKQSRTTFYLTAHIEQQRVKYPLTNVKLSIGKAESCEIKTSGWFAPRVAAQIQRHSDGFYVVPRRRGKTHLNGSKITAPTQLREGDCLAVRNVVMMFEKVEMLT